MTGLYRAHNIYYKNLSKFRAVYIIYIQLPVSAGDILAALTINILYLQLQSNIQFNSEVWIELSIR